MQDIMRFTRNGFIAIVMVTFLCNCNMKDADSQKTTLHDILETDKGFSELSKLHGMRKAFIEYIDNDGILLRPNHNPILGAEAIDYLTQTNDSSFSLTWKPSAGEVAASGELGFTYGIYTLLLKDSTIRGTYVSIWKKQKDGKWKFVLDSGNEGIGK